MKNSATRSFINAANEFEKAERILLYYRVSNYFINQDTFKSVTKLREFNKDLEVPYELDTNSEKEFLEIKYYENTLSTMIYIRTIDNFINYFKEILSEVVVKNPKILKSADKESLDFILSYDNYEALVNALIEKKVESLFFGGISEIQKYFKERLGITLFEEKSDEINLLIKQRNLAVHNQSKISKEFIKQFPEENFEQDAFLSFKFEYVEKIILALYKIINDMDSKLSEKFKLTLIEY